MEVFYISIALLLMVLQLVFLWKISASRREAEALGKMLGEAERTGKMLIRRDLMLTRANEKLRELHDDQSHFVSIVAHQLRTPLSGIKWTLNMELSGDLGELTAEQRAFLSKCQDSNDRMIALVNDMLDADRIDSRRAEYRFERIDIVDAIDGVLYDLLPKIKEAGIHVVIDYKSKEIPRVLADPEKIWAVLQNLLENAVKYTIREGTITISVETNDDAVHVAIRDTGIGVPRAEQEHLFDRFFRAKNAVKVHADGSGLGLYIAKNIITKHGGRMWFEDPGQGSIFHFTLPIKGAE